MCAWIELHCVHTDDRWLGRPFRLLLWQKWVIFALFTVRGDGLRVVRWALIGIAKKNGKTELCAALALFFAFGPSSGDRDEDGNFLPEPAALVVVAAGSDEQADKLFGASKFMAERSPTLSLILEVYEDEILCPSLPGSKIKRVAAAAKKTSSTLDGPNIYVVICDELHCWEGPLAKVVWDTLTNGGVTRRQPLVLQITTAGFDPDTICGQEYEYGLEQVKLGPGDEGYDPSYFFWWVEPPRDADFRDPAVIAASNPSFGRIMSIEYYETQLRKKTEAVFRRYFLNQWTEAAETWMEHGEWESLAVGPFDVEVDAAGWVSTDAATKHDSTAHVLGQWHECAEGCPGWSEEVDRPRADGAGMVRKLRLKAWIWERPFDPRTRRPLEGWRLPIAEVENKLRELRRVLGPNLKSCGYDPSHFHRSADQLETEGLPMEEFPQSDARMVPAAQTLYQLVVDDLIEHEGDERFDRHIRNAVAVQARGGNGGWRLAKGKSKHKMDAAVAAAMTCLLATTSTGDEAESVYETRGMVTVGGSS